MKRRAQAALEYLMTYGWGLIAILVVIGGLSYFGMFEPSRYLPDHCSFGAQLQCNDYQVVASDGSNGGIVYLRLRNGFGDGITITNAYVGDVQTKFDVEADGSFDIVAGNVSSIFIVVLPVDVITVAEDDRQPLSLTLEFQRTSPAGPKHNVSGELFGTSIAQDDGMVETPPIDPPEEK